MKQKILEYIVKEFGQPAPKRTKHYSYCSFPAEACSCRHLDAIGYDTELITGGFIDSFEMVSVLVFVQHTFGVKIPDSEATPENFGTVNRIAELVKRHLR